MTVLFKYRLWTVILHPLVLSITNHIFRSDNIYLNAHFLSHFLNPFDQLLGTFIAIRQHYATVGISDYIKYFTIYFHSMYLISSVLFGMNINWLKMMITKFCFASLRVVFEVFWFNCCQFSNNLKSLYILIINTNICIIYYC